MTKNPESIRGNIPDPEGKEEVETEKDAWSQLLNQLEELAASSNGYLDFLDQITDSALKLEAMAAACESDLRQIYRNLLHNLWSAPNAVRLDPLKALKEKLIEANVQESQMRLSR